MDYFVKEPELPSEYRRRNSENIVKYQLKEMPIPDGWQVTELKTRNKLEKLKGVSENLEDKTWCLFYELGFRNLSGPRGITLEFTVRGRSYSRQIDVVAYDDDFIFIVECKSQETLGPKSTLNKDISDLNNNKHNIFQEFKKIINKNIKPIFLISSENIVWGESNIACAEDNNIHVFDEYDVLKLRELAKVTGEAAKYQIYNQILYDTRIKGFAVKVPAIQSEMGGKKYFSFSMLPEHLLKISFVHQRKHRVRFADLSDSYQRLLQPRRMKSIESYIEDDGFFPGNIILNFRKPVKVEYLSHKQKCDPNVVGKSKHVIITLPQYYGSAWVIDGQHRLYGFSGTDKKFTETLSVVAFEEETASTQARIFVDINENQKAIGKDLLWDLYEDLYSNSSEITEQEKRCISMIAKKLNTKGVFKGLIEIPKEGNKGRYNFNSFCRLIANNNLISGSDAPLFNKSFSESVNYASDRLDTLIKAFIEYLPKLWGSGETCFISSQAGLNTIFAMFNDLASAYSPTQIATLSKFKERTEELFWPVLNHLDGQSDSDLIEMINASAGRIQSSVLQYELTKLIVDDKPGHVASQFVKKYEERKKHKLATKPYNKLIEDDESNVLEFKGSMKLDVDRLLLGDKIYDGKDRLAKDGILKTICAFLNSKDGGNLIIGVLEKNKYQELAKTEEYPIIGNKIIWGIKNEYERIKNGSKDSYENILRGLISEHIGEQPSSIEVKFFEYKGIELCHISVESSAPTWAYLDSDKFYIRDGNRTIELKGEKRDKYQAKFR